MGRYEKHQANIRRLILERAQAILKQIEEAPTAKVSDLDQFYREARFRRGKA